MKKLSLLSACLIVSLCSYSQVSVEEPEFINSYNILTSDASFDQLPKESGKLEKHQNKTSKLSKIAGTVASVGVSAATVGMVSSNSISGLKTGLQAATTAMAVGDAADAVGFLAGQQGMDITFVGKQSSYVINKSDDPIRILVKCENNEVDPLDIYRIVKFKTSKKDRRIQWYNIQSSLLNDAGSKEKGYLIFTGSKYGEKSYILTIPSSEIEAGEYGIVYTTIATSTEIPVGTFSIVEGKK